MFKLTCFVPIEPVELENLLKGIHFSKVKRGLEWHMDGRTFRIEPFENQPRDSMKAYRVYFDGEIYGGSHLFDLTLGSMGAVVTGVECILNHPSMKHRDWMDHMQRRYSYQMIDAKGLFMKKGVAIIIVNDFVTLQMHSRKNKKLIMVDCLKKIDLIREEIMPVEFDLFTCNQEEEIA